MKITILRETAPHETRVAATPETVALLVRLGCEVYVQKEAGIQAGFSDESYAQAGAKLSKIPLELLADADMVLKVQLSPRNHAGDGLDEYTLLKEHSCLVSFFAPHENLTLIQHLARRKVHCFAMEYIPRIARAQSMDALSSQANLAGYRAVVEALYHFPHIFPMMMTAAGTLTPAKILVLGAGIAGLQSIATAKRLGAVVTAFDVRPSAKEQVKSLGAQFIEISSEEAIVAETAGGYAKEMSEAYKQKQQQVIFDAVRKHSIIICTAQIPGKAAPQLITESMIHSMPPGSVIVDTATANGGNCALSVREQIVKVKEVTIIGYSNLPARIPTDASKLYAKNLLNFIIPMLNKHDHSIRIPLEDPIIQATLLTSEGAIVHPSLLAHL